MTPFKINRHSSVCKREFRRSSNTCNDPIIGSLRQWPQRHCRQSGDERCIYIIDAGNGTAVTLDGSTNGTLATVALPPKTALYVAVNKSKKPVCCDSR